MQATDCKERSKTAARTSVPICTQFVDTGFIHQDQEFCGEMTRIIFCSRCGASIGVVVAISTIAVRFAAITHQPITGSRANCRVQYLNR
jgi:hypothetical protein